MNRLRVRPSPVADSTPKRCDSSCLPKFIAPQVPILSPEPPGGDGWIHEIKHDGFRILLRIERDNIRAFTRGGHDWTDKYRRVIEACSKFKCKAALIDA